MSMFRHQAIYNTHSNVVGVNEHRGAIDKDDNIVTLDETKIAEEEAKLQAEFAARAYSRNRQQNYPNEHDLLIALWEKVMEGRSESADALEVKRQEIKTAHPKPE